MSGLEVQDTTDSFRLSSKLSDKQNLVRRFEVASAKWFRVRPQARVRIRKALWLVLLGSTLFSLFLHVRSLSDQPTAAGSVAALIAGVFLLLFVMYYLGASPRFVHHVSFGVLVGVAMLIGWLGGDRYALIVLVCLPFASLHLGRRVFAACLLLNILLLTYGLALEQAELSQVQPESLTIWDGPLGIYTFLNLGLLVLFSVKRDGVTEKDRRGWESATRGIERLTFNAYDALVEVHPDGDVVSASPEMESVLGFTALELGGSPLLEHLHPEDRGEALDLLRECQPSGELARRDLRFVSRAGETVWGRLSGGSFFTTDDEEPSLIFAVQWLDHEHSQLRRLNEMQNLRGLAQFAGGVAHDFNNLLTVIGGYAELLDESDAQQEIANAARQAGELTSQLLAFGRQDPLEEEVFCLNEVIRSSEGMLRSLLRENLELVLELADSLPMIRAEERQVRRVLLNLATNARDAMPDGGHLEVRTKVVELDAVAARRHGVKQGPYIQLAVTDDGEGMTEEVRSRALEPFFTTKESGQGTGLGLASVFGVVQQSRGAVSIWSAPGHGTSVVIHLPVAEDVEGNQQVVDTAETEELLWDVPILLVEDQEEVRSLVLQMLTKAGSLADGAANAEEALTRVETAGFPYKALITDVVMPGLSGLELSARLRHLKPDLPVLFISGYHEDHLNLNSLSDDAPTEFLRKPFTSRDLRRALKGLLGAVAARVEAASSNST